jgi:hypothetical protein
VSDPTFAADLANALEAMAGAVEGGGFVSLHPDIVRRIVRLLRIAQLVNDFEGLGRRGLVVSVCCGPMHSGRAGGAFGWSVDCLCDSSRESFDYSYAARDFGHCLEIVQTEAATRGWIDANQRPV